MLLFSGKRSKHSWWTIRKTKTIFLGDCFAFVWLSRESTELLTYHQSLQPDSNYLLMHENYREFQDFDWPLMELWLTCCAIFGITKLHKLSACLHGGGGPQLGEEAFGGSSRLTCKRDHIKWDIIWTGGLPHLRGLPHLPRVRHLHVNRPFENLTAASFNEIFTSVAEKLYVVIKKVKSWCPIFNS